MRRQYTLEELCAQSPLDGDTLRQLIHAVVADNRSFALEFRLPNPDYSPSMEVLPYRTVVVRGSRSESNRDRVNCSVIDVTHTKVRSLVRRSREGGGAPDSLG